MCSTVPREVTACGLSVEGSEQRRGRSAPPQAREEEEEGGKRGPVSRVDSAPVISELRN